MSTDRLFELTFQFKKTRIWHELYEDELFAIPLSGDRIGYVSITGSMGEHVAVVLYIGEPGLYSFFTLSSEEFGYLTDIDYNPPLLNNHCLQAVLDSKDFLTDDEIKAARDYARRSNIKIAGKNAYPHFLKCEPGIMPYPVEDEQDFADLEAALEAVAALVRGPIVNGFGPADLTSIRRTSAEIPMITVNADGSCKMSMSHMPSVPLYTPPVGDVYDELAAARIRSLPQDGEFQAGLMILPMLSTWAGSRHPVIPTQLVVYDSVTDSDLYVQPVAIYETRTEVMLNKFMESLSELGRRPASIRVCDDYTYALLEKWCTAIGAELEEASGPELAKLIYYKNVNYRKALLPSEFGDAFDDEFLDYLRFLAFEDEFDDDYITDPFDYDYDDDDDDDDYEDGFDNEFIKNLLYKHPEMIQDSEFDEEELEQTGSMLKLISSVIDMGIASGECSLADIESLMEEVDAFYDLMNLLDAPEFIIDQITDMKTRLVNARSDLAGTGTGGKNQQGKSGKSRKAGKGASGGKSGKATGKGKGKKSAAPSHKERTAVISVSLGTGCYRHLQVPDTLTLYDFAREILEAFDFDNDHLHAFFMDNKAWSHRQAYFMDDGSRDDLNPTTDEIRLFQAGITAGQKFLFLFDYGDEWRFQCKVLRIEDEPCPSVRVIRTKGEAPQQYPSYDDWDF